MEELDAATDRCGQPDDQQAVWDGWWDRHHAQTAERHQDQNERLRAQDRLIDELTATARAKAAAVTLATVELVDALRAMLPHEGRIAATMRQWASWQCGLTVTETRRLFRLLERLEELPVLDGAFRAGVLSEGVVEMLVTVATPHNEQALVDAARAATATQLGVLVRDLRAVRRQAEQDARADRAGGDNDDDPATAPSDAWWRWDDEGRFRGGWDLRADEGATLEAALEAELARHRPDEGDIDAPAPTVTDGELRPEERPRCRRSDALVGLGRTSLCAAADDGLLPESHQIIIRTQTEGPIGHDGRFILEGCGPIERWLADLAGCDSLQITQDMIDGFPVSTPTTTRSFNRSQRRALRARDRHCRFPGCGRRWHLHAHHTDEWADTNRTSVSRAVLLCPQHHALVHLRAHRISLLADHSVVVTRPDNTSIRGAPLPPPEACTRPPDPPPDRRLTGLGEPLTREARSTYLQHWNHLDEHDPTPHPAPP